MPYKHVFTGTTRIIIKQKVKKKRKNMRDKAKKMPEIDSDRPAEIKSDYRMRIYREIVRKLEVASTMSNGDIVNMEEKTSIQSER